MSGHSKWANIKHKKGAKDAQRSANFGKLSRVITIAAKEKGPNPDMNPALRTAIEKAQMVNMPKDTIERAIAKASMSADTLQQVTYEAFGPGGVAIIIEGITDNNNRTFSEIRKILSDHDTKMAPGGALWAFKKSDDEWIAQTTVEADDVIREKIATLVEILDEHDDIQSIFTNIAPSS
ncbi:MAG: YebC/PmpR family DNA-binding transcriptional regulator [Candidatus Ryanbacteria bacterium CG10_big_fil_rev_8_21_14_0_10_43_42]|uniref:YebC/PmpR family DNA-binding transcriptional regulator n=1 Tax=Candidatus Ryanbacteria bacterium CG10_big_fil_rev_8_21_14_0_10_43_42 TaxID=1974864 RepID=A0A2M8KWE3_9BACT|nr:MAG: YebC/PmpR family DNA-binding transcriptional regulator [Candidatus Ryanbacteria bacterium CG10_big_fil_rev_8_21_14_0_10_43_42]